MNLTSMGPADFGVSPTTGYMPYLKKHRDETVAHRL